MFATYSLNIRRLLTQSICSRPNLHVKSEHLANIPQILVSHIRLCLPNNHRVFTGCSRKLFVAVHFFSVRVHPLVHPFVLSSVILYSYSPALKRGWGLYRIWVVCHSVHLFIRPFVIIFLFQLNILNSFIDFKKILNVH